MAEITYATMSVWPSFELSEKIKKKERKRVNRPLIELLALQ